MSVLDLFRLDGKKALVTGASSGIGKRVALAYTQAGAEVVIAARNYEALERSPGRSQQQVLARYCPSCVT